MGQHCHWHLAGKIRNRISLSSGAALSLTPEASLLVLEFTISVYSSSFNYLFFSLLLAPLLSLSVYWQSKAGWNGKKYVEQENNRYCSKKRDLHELPWSEIVNFGTIRRKTTKFTACVLPLSLTSTVHHKVNENNE